MCVRIVFVIAVSPSFGIDVIGDRFLASVYRTRVTFSESCRNQEVIWSRLMRSGSCLPDDCVFLLFFFFLSSVRLVSKRSWVFVASRLAFVVLSRYTRVERLREVFLIFYLMIEPVMISYTYTHSFFSNCEQTSVAWQEESIIRVANTL